MYIQQNVSLKQYNTFGIDVPAAYYTSLEDATDLPELSEYGHQKYILGGGSNILLTKPVNGLVIHNKLKGITIEREDEEHVWLRVQAGEVWHELVLYAIKNGWGGIENLALIPGTAGASPMQNIGAYGVEAKDTIDSVSFWYWKEKTFLTYSNRNCNFGYRDSIFKQQLKDKVLITSVLFRLDKQPKYNVSYGAITEELEHMGVTGLSVKAIAYAVISIRTGKLPDPKRIGNAGSFFKNPTLSRLQFDMLLARYPRIPSYRVSDALVKVPAGWLIEQCGYKGYRAGDTGVHIKQALVLVNYGQASGAEVWALSSEIVAAVKERFAITLEREVQVW